MVHPTFSPALKVEAMLGSAVARMVCSRTLRKKDSPMTITMPINFLGGRYKVISWRSLSLRTMVFSSAGVTAPFNIEGAVEVAVLYGTSARVISS